MKLNPFSRCVPLFLPGLVVGITALTLTRSTMPALAQPSVVEPHAPEAIASKYRLTFDDEFKGTHLDSQKWIAGFPWGSCQTRDTYTDYCPDHYKVDQGHLSLEVTAPGQDGKTSGGVISTRQAWTHGFFEARIKMPKGDGLWANFWTDGTHTWPPEVDIAEFLGSNPRSINWTSHYKLNGKPELNHVQVSTPDLTQNYHIYGLQWESRAITFYLDGKPVKTMTGVAVPRMLQHFIFRAGTGSQHWGGTIAQTQFPTAMKVDYFRVFQKS